MSKKNKPEEDINDLVTVSTSTTATTIINTGPIDDENEDFPNNPINIALPIVTEDTGFATMTDSFLEADSLHVSEASDPNNKGEHKRKHKFQHWLVLLISQCV